MEAKKRGANNASGAGRETENLSTADKQATSFNQVFAVLATKQEAL